MMPSKSLSRILVLLALAALICLAGCGRNLPPEVTGAVEALSAFMDKTDKAVADRETQYKKQSQSKAFESMAAVAQRENWAGRFEAARESLGRARAQYKEILVPLVDADKPESAPEILSQTQRLQSLVAGADEASRFPQQRMALIQKLLDNPQQALSRARKAADTLTREISLLETGVLAAALAEFPGAREAIQTRFAPFAQMQRQTRERLVQVKEISNALNQGKTLDAGVFTDATQGILSDAKAFATRGPAFEKSLKSLYLSYTKVLQDMKTDLKLTIRRESWDENSDYETGRQVGFTRMVTPEVFNALANAEGPIATIVPGFSGMRLKNNVGGSWNNLNIHPTEQWPDRYHNAAEFWVEDASEAYFHKYLIEENGKTRETDWEAVNPSFYQQHVENLGMAILSKPYGVFEDEALAQPAPPGMANVGNPKYGEWKEDNNGNQFWAWYGRYAFFSNLFFFPPYYYPYGSWYGWHTGYRHKKPYYGTTKNGKRRFGTFGSQVKTSPKYRNSTFAKTGGFKSGPISVRGAGSRVRGGGPGGKGK